MNTESQHAVNQHAVNRHGNVIAFPGLNSPFVVGNFLRALYQGQERGYQDFVLDFSNTTSAFPNVCAPIAGIVDYYRSELGTSFDFRNTPDYLDRTRTFSPSIVGDDDSHKNTPMDTVWKFSSPDEVHSLTNSYVDSVSSCATCEPGVIIGLNWCLYEIMDNVIQHSDITHGYVMAQIHPGAQHVAICVYDHGIGIFNSLRSTEHRPASPVDAITIALQQGITRDKNVGQGNGMWGLYNIVDANSGFLNVTSGSGYFGMGGGTPRTSSSVPFLSRDNNCTTVDFQIDFDKTISVPDALGGYEPVNMRLENLEDDHDRIVYKMAEQSSGTGTRKSGEAIRNEIANILNQTESLVHLDFSGVSVVSSSFGDELIGKLAVKIGFITFNQRIRLIGMNETVQSLVNHSVSLRLSTGLDDNN